MCGRLPHLVAFSLALAIVSAGAGESEPEIKKASEQSGVTVQLTGIEEILGNPFGGARRGLIEEGLWQPGLRLDLQRLLHWPGATFEINGYWTHGPSLSNHYVQDLNVLSNIDAYDTIRLNEVWLEQSLIENRFWLRAGLLVVDTDFSICQSGTVFVNSAFGPNALLTANFNLPTFPLSAPGLVSELKATESLTLRAGAFSADVGTEPGNNRHGGRFSFSSKAGGLYLAELEQRLALGPSHLPGTIKLTGAWQSRQQVQTLLATWDQGIYRVAGEKERGVNLFARGGVCTPEGQSVVEGEMEFGAVAHGLFSSRAKDLFGLAFCFTRLGSDPEIQGTTHHESILEATYQYAFNDHVSLQPDAQLIFNPGGTQRANTALVLGLRCTYAY